jgi:hypothetical protein
MSNLVFQNLSPVAPTTGMQPARTLNALRGVNSGIASISPWKWCLLASILLAGSGTLRLVRDLQFQTVTQQSANCPFPLSEIGSELGTWREVKGTQTKLDEEVARVAGSSEHFVRMYTDLKTGETASVMVLYGLAAKVFGHTPAACYPAAGYSPVASPEHSSGQPLEIEFRIPESPNPIRIAKAFYARRAGGFSEYTEAVWTFRHDGVWQPDMSDRWKRFRSRPGMFKIQIHRPTLALSSESGSESLMRELVTDIERRLAASESVKTAKLVKSASN